MPMLVKKNKTQKNNRNRLKFTINGRFLSHQSTYGWFMTCFTHSTRFISSRVNGLLACPEHGGILQPCLIPEGTGGYNSPH